MTNQERITELFNLGAVIAGGAAIAHLFNHNKIKDLDFWINDLEKYNQGKKYQNLNIELIYYSTPNPYDSFDLTISQCYLNNQGELIISPQCLKSYHTKIIKLNRNNIFYPQATLKRIYKYQNKFKMDVDQEDLKYLRDLI